MHVLIISDLHLGDYSTYGYVANSEYEFIKLSYKLKEVCTNNNISEIWVLGDIVQYPLIKPKEMILIKKFFNNLSNIKIRGILGNHDQAIYFNQKEDNILDRLLKICNVEILNNNILNIDNKKIYFVSYNNKIKNIKADVLLTHCTMSDLDSKSFDNFSRIILGHEHKYFKFKNVISCDSILRHSKEETNNITSGLIMNIDKTIDITRIKI